MDTTLLGVTAAAAFADCHPKTLLRALRRGELRGYQRGQNCKWRIFQADLEAWVRGEEPPKVEKSA